MKSLQRSFLSFAAAYLNEHCPIAEDLVPPKSTKEVSLKILHCLRQFTDEDTIDHRSYTHNLSSFENKAWKNIQACAGFEPA